MPSVCLVKSFSQWDILLQYIVLTVNDDQLLCVVGVVVVVGGGGVHLQQLGHGG